MSIIYARITATIITTDHRERGFDGLVYLANPARPARQNPPYALYIGGQVYWRSGGFIDGLGGL